MPERALDRRPVPNRPVARGERLVKGLQQHLKRETVASGVQVRLRDLAGRVGSGRVSPPPDGEPADGLVVEVRPLHAGQRGIRHRVVADMVEYSRQGGRGGPVQLCQDVPVPAGSRPRPGEQQDPDRGHRGRVAGQGVQDVKQALGLRFLGIVDYYQPRQRHPVNPAVAAPQPGHPPGALKAFAQLNGEAGLAAPAAGRHAHDGHRCRRVRILTPRDGFLKLGVTEQVRHHAEVGPQQARRGRARSPLELCPGLVKDALRPDGKNRVPGPAVPDGGGPVRCLNLSPGLGQGDRNLLTTGEQGADRHRPAAEIGRAVPGHRRNTDDRPPGRADQRGTAQSRRGLSRLETKKPVALYPLEAERRRRANRCDAVFPACVSPCVTFLIAGGIACIEQRTRMLHVLPGAQHGHVRVGPETRGPPGRRRRGTRDDLPGTGTDVDR